MQHPAKPRDLAGLALQVGVLERQKAACAAFEVIDFICKFVVAGIGFEPMTFRL